MAAGLGGLGALGGALVLGEDSEEESEEGCQQQPGHGGREEPRATGPAEAGSRALQPGSGPAAASAPPEPAPPSAPGRAPGWDDLLVAALPEVGRVQLGPAAKALEGAALHAQALQRRTQESVHTRLGMIGTSLHDATAAAQSTLDELQQAGKLRGALESLHAPFCEAPAADPSAEP